MQPTKTKEPLSPGIYFGLDEDEYHADPALGSSDLRTVLRSPPAYWWFSWMNPVRPDPKSTKAQDRGTAMHKWVLEGRQAFEALYMRRPDDPTGATSAEKGTLTKRANADAAAIGKECLHGDTWDRIAIAGGMIAANEKLSGAFSGGIPEVSVFWMSKGIRMKARIDYLKPKACTDLKSISNQFGIDFPERCRQEIRNRKLPMQALHYLDARREMPAMAKAGLLHGNSGDKKLFDRIMAEPEYAFAWVFFQADGAPLTWGRKVSPFPGEGNPVLMTARQQIDTAILKFREHVTRFGTEMWVVEDELAELDPTEDLRDLYGMYD